MPKQPKTKPVTIISNKIKVPPENIFEGTVVKSGNGAVITFRKEFIGEQVYVIRKEKCRTR